MGIFSSKTKHVYTPYSMLLYEDMAGVVPQTVKTSILYNRNIGKDLVANIVNGVLFKAQAYYNQAKKPDHPWGLPEGTATATLPTTRNMIQAIVEKVAGRKVYLHTVYMEQNTDTGGIDYTVNYYLMTGDKTEGTELEWKYNTLAGTYPMLEPKEGNQNSPYYPITPIRIAGQNLAEKGMPDRLAVRAALTKLGLKVDDLYKAFEDSVEEDPEVEIADDVFILLAVSVASKQPRSMEYLYRFFQKQHGMNPSAENEYAYRRKNSGSMANQIMPNLCKLEIKDSRFHQVLEWDYIREELCDGTIPTAEGSTKPVKVGDCWAQYKKGDSRKYRGYTDSTHGLEVMCQISKTQYMKLFVHGLICKTLVIGQSWETVELSDAFENPDSPQDGQCFLVPLRKDIVEEMGNIKGHDLMYDAIRMYSNDHDTYKVKWYQRGVFKVLALVVAVVVSIWFPPFGITAWSAMAVAYAAISVTISMALMPLVVKLLEDIIGPELALLVGMLASAYAGGAAAGALANTATSGVSAGAAALAGGKSALTGIFSNASAFTVMNTVTSLTSAIYGQNAASVLEDIAREREALQKEMDAYDKAELSNSYNPYDTYNRIKSYRFQNMTADTFVKRALMEPEMPTYTVEMTENFVRVMQSLDTSRTDLQLGH